ncbi:hypothetical protein ABH944_004647 [Caballeronia udeis]|uniref:Uncharacterized protein n=1 Tax=Caballeronia udeis TaxID=1232866 RepID=A0ABW8MMY3_9BURK
MHAASPEPICPGNFDRSFWTARHYYKPCFRHNRGAVTCPYFPGVAGYDGGFLKIAHLRAP